VIDQDQDRDDVDNDDNDNDDTESIASTSFSTTSKSSFRLIKRGPSIAGSSESIPILPIPLPSKRFKKNAGSRAVLIPVEQLPVFPLPPLPVIDNESLLKQVFTHQSCFPRSRGRFEDPEDDPAMHYEKLEHVGDSILGMVVTTWLHEAKPLLTCGTATVSK
jgi:dsRNA-specific ribonuclease